MLTILLMPNDSLCRGQISAGTQLQASWTTGIPSDQVRARSRPGPLRCQGLGPTRLGRAAECAIYLQAVTRQLELHSNPALSKSLLVIRAGTRSCFQLQIILLGPEHQPRCSACPFSACSMPDKEETHRKTTYVMVLPSLVTKATQQPPLSTSCLLTVPVRL